MIARRPGRRRRLDQDGKHRILLPCAPGAGAARGRSRADGRDGPSDRVGEQTPVAGRSAVGQKAPDRSIAYFPEPAGRMGDFGRLRAARSVGSGPIEGSAQRGWAVGRKSLVAGGASVDSMGWPP